MNRVYSVSGGRQFRKGVGGGDQDPGGIKKEAKS